MFTLFGKVIRSIETRAESNRILIARLTVVMPLWNRIFSILKCGGWWTKARFFLYLLVLCCVVFWRFFRLRLHFNSFGKLYFNCTRIWAAFGGLLALRVKYGKIRRKPENCWKLLKRDTTPTDTHTADYDIGSVRLYHLLSFVAFCCALPKLDTTRSRRDVPKLSVLHQSSPRNI